MVDLTSFAARLSTSHLARVVVRLRDVGSTNDVALALSKLEARPGLVVTADRQTAGRGQRGRRWASEPGDGLYSSFVLRPNLRPTEAAAITLAAGLAVHAGLQSLTPVPLGLKWPNDVLVGEPGHRYGRKLAGILFESVAGADAIHHAILGIGVNLRVPHDPALAPFATGLESLEATTTEPLHVLATIANRLEPELERLERSGLSALCREWTEHALGIGQSVEVHHPDHVEVGRFDGLSSDGNLRLTTPRGTRTIHSGRLSLPNVPFPPKL